jgi:hypothetical protein
VRNADGILDDAAPEKAGRNLLLFGKPVIEAINQNIRVNETGHGGTGPPSSILDLEHAVLDGPTGAFDFVLLPGQRGEAATPDPERQNASPVELLESLRPPKPTQSRRQGEVCRLRRFSSATLLGTSM